jgi:predicted metal-dependent enzyme (double-stranded beta helix superfamily)
MGSYMPTELIRAGEAIVDREGVNETAFREIGRCLRRLAGDPDIISEERLVSLHGSGATATILGRGSSGSVLMLAQFPSESETPIHNHNSWGVACVVQGRDRYRKWDRVDDGSDPDRADIRLAWERDLEPGDFVWFGLPPDDIHSQQGIDEAAIELVYFGSDPFAHPRAYFDPATGVVTHADAAAR